MRRLTTFLIILVVAFALSVPAAMAVDSPVKVSMKNYLDVGWYAGNNQWAPLGWHFTAAEVWRVGVGGGLAWTHNNGDNGVAATLPVSLRLTDGNGPLGKQWYVSVAYSYNLDNQDNVWYWGFSFR